MREFLLKIARKAIEDLKYIPKEIPNWAKENRGVFVTLTENGKLRGCIGYPLPVMPLWRATLNAARAAAYDDPRFNPLTKNEINKIKVEVSVLTVPRLLEGDPKEFPNKIEIGKDGLMIEDGLHSGLLLPQVAKEYNFTPIQFLDETCIKAGLLPGCWKHAKVYKFQAEIFSED